MQQTLPKAWRPFLHADAGVVQSPGEKGVTLLCLMSSSPQRYLEACALVVMSSLRQKVRMERKRRIKVILITIVRVE